MNVYFRKKGISFYKKIIPMLKNEFFISLQGNHLGQFICTKYEPKMFIIGYYY